eukprot:3068325-Amphidinium_carterae.1
MGVRVCNSCRSEENETIVRLKVGLQFKQKCVTYQHMFAGLTYCSLWAGRLSRASSCTWPAAGGARALK